MKISRINVYQVDLPLHEGRYSWSEGKSVDVFDSTVVEIETDAGITGYGEVNCRRCAETRQRTHVCFNGTGSRHQA